MDRTIRALIASDVEPLAQALAEAFERDDFAPWIFPDPAQRASALLSMFRSRLGTALQDSNTLVDVVADCSGAAIWQAPVVPFDGDPPPGVRNDVVDAFAAVTAARPTAAHWYLHGIGARIGGQGVGSALIAAGLRRLDGQGVPTALFTGDVGNVAFYAKHGYRELWRGDFPGASLWWMWRDPA